MADKTDWIVDGFQFGTQTDAELAKSELKRIERLKEKLEYSNPNMVNAVYKKAIDNRIFKTPVGYGFLKKLQSVLKENATSEEEIANIPVYGVYSLRESTNPAVEKVKASQKKVKEKTKQEFFSRRTSIIVNIGLFVLVIIMFFISYTSKSPTVLNYEKTIQNRYSAWEQELMEREQVIREKEKEFLISD